MTVQCLCLSARSTNKVAIAGGKWIYVRQAGEGEGEDDKQAGRQAGKARQKPKANMPDNTRRILNIHVYAA